MKIENIDKYIASQNPEAQVKLIELRTILRNALPDAEDDMHPESWTNQYTRCEHEVNR